MKRKHSLNIFFYVSFRALELIEVFFRKVVNDKTLQDSLKNHLQEAYTETLKPYHGFIVQTAFSVSIVRLVLYLTLRIMTNEPIDLAKINVLLRVAHLN